MTPSPTAPPANAAHIADLDATGAVVKKGWQGKVTILVHDQAHKPVSSAVVLGSWSNNPGVIRSCTTRKGTCRMTSDTLGTAVPEVTFTVTGVSHSTLAYNLSANHDPDGDSNGTMITIRRP
jgi:hypothetical protein